MQATKSMRGVLVLAMATGTIGLSGDTIAQEIPANAGPPAWVVEAWESGNAPVVPVDGPPAWVVEAWQNGEMPQRPSGPPAWVVARQEMANELGLPGPPPEVRQAWEDGVGFELPGPSSFIFDLIDF